MYNNTGGRARMVFTVIAMVAFSARNLREGME
jgi:hypothetical protein